MMNPKKLKRAEESFADQVIEHYGEKEDDSLSVTKNVSEEKDMLHNEPFINVIEKERFDERVEQVFEMVGEVLARSYGPYGATTIISQYPWYHITKDGYTIQKNVAFDKTNSFVDQIICGLISDICGRLNYSVGDGTTTATVATNEIYQAYRSMIDVFKEKRFLPRDVMRRFEDIKSKVIEKVSKMAVKINSLPKEEMIEYIYNITSVASNGDDTITNIITTLYQELTYPAITVTLAPDGVTKKKIIHGFSLECSLRDKLYINTDDHVMKLGYTDVLIFDHKITMDTYMKILQPMSQTCKNRGRHLVCIAPFYDQVAIDTRIKGDLREEYGAFRDINLVLMTCKYQTEHHKKMLNNLAILCNTEIISQGREMELCRDMEAMLTGKTDAAVACPFNIDNRNLFGTRVLLHLPNGDFSEILNEDNQNFIKMTAPEGAVRMGFFGEGSLGEKTSIFGMFLATNQAIYEAALKEAEEDLTNMEKKYQSLGTFNVEVDQAQERLNALRLTVGIAEVGSASTFSQGYLRDAIVDCVKATRSAYKFGVVPGCSVSILCALDECRKEFNQYGIDDLTDAVLRIFTTGFKNVYRTILFNMTDDWEIVVPEQIHDFAMMDAIVREVNRKYDFNIPYIQRDCDDSLKELWRFCSIRMDETETQTESLMVVDVSEFIIRMSCQLHCAFDLVLGTFSPSVINSVETDIQILHAVSDLTKLLVTGNQLVVSMYGQYSS